MLEKQTKLMKLRRRVMRSKLRTEKLKQAMIQNKLTDNGMEIPSLEPSSESSSEDESFDE
jgi:hypothetical protein